MLLYVHIIFTSKIAVINLDMITCYLSHLCGQHASMCSAFLSPSVFHFLSNKQLITMANILSPSTPLPASDSTRTGSDDPTTSSILGEFSVKAFEYPWKVIEIQSQV